VIQGRRIRRQQQQRGDAGQVQEIAFHAGLAELRPGLGHRQKLDRAEAELRMDLDDRHPEDNRHGNAHQRDVRAHQHRDAGEQLDRHRGPGHDERRGNVQPGERGGEHVDAAPELEITVHQKSAADHEAQGKRGPMPHRGADIG